MHRTAGTGAFCSSWRYRFLNFTHVAARARWGCGSSPLRSLVLHPPSLLLLSRSSARSHIPVGGTPYCFIQRDQFLFHSTFLSFSLPLARSFFSLSLYGLLYALSSVPFVHARLFARADFEPDSLQRERSAEEGRTNPVKRREIRTMAEKKKMRQ